MDELNDVSGMATGDQPIQVELGSAVLTSSPNSLDPHCIMTRYMKHVDRFHEWNVSSWATPGGALSHLHRWLLQPKSGWQIVD